MALVVALRFSSKSGALCVDQESWHLLRRKTFFSDCIYSLLTEEMADRTGSELIYAGVGHPSFHMEVATKSEKAITEYLNSRTTAKLDTKNPQSNTKKLAEIVCDVFRNVHRRRISDRLEYLYGFSTEDFLNRKIEKGNQSVPITQEKVLQHSRDILEGKDALGYPPLSPAIEAIIIGVDQVYGFSGFTLKEQEGVLSFHSCGFDALGCGRYVAATGLTKFFNNLFLDSRRTGIGKPAGLYHIIDAMIEGIDHSGQVGGNIRLVMIDAEAKTRENRLRVLSLNRSRLSLEIVRAARNNFISRETAQNYLVEIIDKKRTWEQIEKDFFSNSGSPEKMEKLLRGYKIEEENCSITNITKELFSPPNKPSVQSRKKQKSGL
ncbi:MAG: hypothetical protein A2161_21525 [Candidatus Schekmanbacteria bacterium RBG_13_48_7]|uniref:Uncharacterized protein n=1 Tax=Candidatus Schekmanbacteria bacterium RBG_13_48_7 TaxID=1817878 RepID=A0A1F7RRQ3_9BACT|nr:MAG: hypothetical protein A2161_21525 [Candidatus Schekmanbacteria bacterium RBG_13_48_7]